jgi:hypothetical protein
LGRFFSEVTANQQTKMSKNMSKSILLGKQHDVTAFASKDSRRYVLNSVHYSEKHKAVEATDGHVFVRVPVIESDEFPPVKTPATEVKDCIMPIQAVSKAVKNIPRNGTIPVLSHAKLDVNGTIALTTTDLETEQCVEAKPIEGTYPNCDQVIPDFVPVLTIAIAADVLIRLGQYAAKHATGSSAPVRFEFLNGKSAFRFSMAVKNLETEVKAIGVAMPVAIA